MSLPLIFSPQAAREALDARDYYDEQREGLAIEFHRELNITLARIAKMPGSYAIVEDDVRRVRLHRFPYTVYYRIALTHVDIVAVVHARRDRSAWRDRL